jgi:DNA polymerase-3 subunit alpha
MAAVLNNASNIDKLTFFMEESKKMGIKVLGPDINESLKGFAVNKTGDIRFGLGGLKGVGDAAVESIIEERKKNGSFKDIFDFIKRINQKTVSKKTLESLVYGGAFDAFSELHRAQYFCMSEGESVTGLEKIIRYGNLVQSQTINSTNTLFGDLPAVMEIRSPQIQNCPPWPLTVQLDHEKTVAGIFLSGHPLDHYKFEFKHYDITPLQDFNDIKDSGATGININKTYRLLCLVADANHRVSKQGNKFGAFTVEDYTGRTEIMLWGDDYVRYHTYLQQGQALLICGNFRLRYNKAEYEFKVTSIALAENIKRMLTKQLQLEMDPRVVKKETVDFLEKNLKSYPGKAGFKVIVSEPKNNWRVNLVTIDNGFEMNNDMISFLEETPEIDIHVISA